MLTVYHQETKYLLASYSPKKLGFPQPSASRRPLAAAVPERAVRRRGRSPAGVGQLTVTVA
ncbi:hypothetical protein STRTUCAR8_01009 [Streptomyces turgidiscabies Car8]|uniref:Uncharacterized protein n=1 Tax=Streptomyces turgidiscabies (strain Car8) TaxID=698760 RepID=L7F4X1_STRT8|nr:hypothetical protein STRTUCAR8_01009 [Streptomyces turgidiscabies Car8]